jgi:hypothetical protein
MTYCHFDNNEVQAAYLELHVLASVVIAQCAVLAYLCTFVCELIHVSQHAALSTYGVFC